MAEQHFENLAYTLHFHSLSHSISANYYQEFDQGLGYLSTITVALVTALGGSLLVPLQDNNRRLKVFATLVLIAATIATDIIGRVNSGDHAPGKEKVLHHETATQLRTLRDNVEYFKNTMKENQTDAEKRFHEFVSEKSRIDKKCQSETWTFPQVHKELSPRAKTLGKKRQKYFPRKESQAYISVSVKWIFLCGFAVVIFSLWKISFYIA